MTQITTASRRGSTDERSAHARIDAAAKLLRGVHGGAPESFVALLFGHTAPEDLIVYEATELAALVRDAYALLATRKPGAAKVRFEVPPASAGDHLK